MKKLIMRIECFLMLLLVVVCSCSTARQANSEPTSKSATVQTTEPVTGQSTEHDVDFSFENAAVKIPSPASVQLDPDGRLGARFKGNVNYVRYQHDHYGEFMLESFATRHYSPGKLLERVWDGEYAGKWLDAATRTTVNTGDDAQLAMVDDFAASLRKYQQPDGYMGIKLPTDRELNYWEQGWDVWVQWNSMIGFLTHYELRGDSDSLEAASRVGDWIVKAYSPIESEQARFLQSGMGFTNVAVIGQLMRLHRHTGNEELLEFVGKVIQNYPPIQQMLSSGEPFLIHPYMLSAVLMGVLDYAEATKDTEMLAKVEQVWQGLVDDHLFPTGSLGNREDLQEGPLKDVPGAQLQETCATTEWIFFTQSLYAITGRAKYAAELERTSYNALLAAQSADGMRWCYWTPLRYSKHWFHGPTRCCFWSGPKGIARLPQLIYATKGNAVYVNFFETSHAVLDTDDGQVQVTQDSEVPGVGKSTVTLKTPSDWKGTLRVRVPTWSADFQAKLNGSGVPNGGDMKGYRDIDLEGSSEYRIEIQFNMPLLLENLSENDYVLRRGPEVLSVDVRDNIETWLGANDDLITIPNDI
ncbi:MAG: beta-L-arabinofuranosidase domain-containing protein, partial [Planctomycetota bacterium]